MDMNISIKLQPDDYALAAKHLNRAFRLGKTLGWTIKATGLVTSTLLTLGLIGLMNYHPRFDASGEALLRNCSGMIFLAVVLSYLANHVVRRTLVLAMLKLESDAASYDLSIDSEGIRITTEVASAVISWQGIFKAEQANGHLYLFTSAIRAIIVPEHSFAKTTDFIAFSTQACTWWNAARSAH